jgi:hypothetical protein
MANTIAPAPRFPERPSTQYEREVKDPRDNYNTAREGTLRFEEGIGTDTDVPTDFQKGIMQGYATPPGRPNHNLNVFEKPAAETMKERAHVGSAAWVDSPDMLGEFAQGSFTDYARQEWLQVQRDGSHYMRPSHAVISD